jgi:hypothetical protein
MFISFYSKKFHVQIVIIENAYTFPLYNSKSASRRFLFVYISPFYLLSPLGVRLFLSIITIGHIYQKLGRTVPSFRIVIAQEKQEWKDFRNALDKSERKQFDEMWDIPRLYVSACSNSCQLVPLHPIIISILFHHYKELKECISEVEQIEGANRATDDSSKNMGLTIEEEQREEVATTLDGYFLFGY